MAAIRGFIGIYGFKRPRGRYFFVTCSNLGQLLPYSFKAFQAFCYGDFKLLCTLFYRIYSILNFYFLSSGQRDNCRLVVMVRSATRTAILIQNRSGTHAQCMVPMLAPCRGQFFGYLLRGSANGDYPDHDPDTIRSACKQIT